MLSEKTTLFHRTALTVFTLTLVATIFSCTLSEEDLSHYHYPERIPSDPFNEITITKKQIGDSLWSGSMGKAISLSGMITCANCHTDDTNGGSPDPGFPGGIGEGASLVDHSLTSALSGTTVTRQRYRLWDDYHGKVDSMTWVNSRSFSNLAFQKIGGVSGRFGQGLTAEEAIAHFGIDTTVVPFSFVRDTLVMCEVGVMQAWVALNGHNQFSSTRLHQHPTLMSEINDKLGTAITKQTPAYQVSWILACCLDVSQRVRGYRNDTRWQRIVRGEEEIRTDEYRGFKTMRSDCAGCHSGPDWSGGLGLSSFPDMGQSLVDPAVDTAPDNYLDIAGTSTEDIMAAMRELFPSLQVMTADTMIRKIPSPVVAGNALYGPAGSYTDLEEYLMDHIAGLNDNYNIPFPVLLRSDTLDPQMISDITAYLKCI